MALPRLQDLALQALEQQLACAPPDWRRGLAAAVGAMAPVGSKWALLVALARRGALTDHMLRCLWSGAEFSGFVSALSLSGCAGVSGSCLAECLGAGSGAGGGGGQGDGCPGAGGSSWVIAAAAGDEGSSGQPPGPGGSLSLAPAVAPAVCLRSLSLHGCHRISDADLCCILPYLGRLASLDCSSCPLLGDEAVKAVGERLYSLTSLDLSECCEVSDLTCLAKCRQLRCLRLAGCWRVAPATASGGPSIRAEDAAEARAPACTRPLPAFLAAGPALTELDVSALPGLTDADIWGLWGAKADLAYLEGGGAVRVEALRSAWPCRTSLTSLSFSGTGISSEVPPCLAAACPALAHLRLSNCRHVAGAAVITAVRIRTAQLTAAARWDRTCRVPPAPQPAPGTSCGSASPGPTAPAPVPCGPVGFQTLAAGCLSSWQEAPETLLGEELLLEVAATAQAATELALGLAAGGLRPLTHPGADGARAADGMGAGPVGAGEVRAQELPGLGVEELGEAAMLEDLFEEAKAAAPEPAPAAAHAAAGAWPGAGVQAGATGAAGGAAVVAPVATALSGLTSLDLSGVGEFSDMAAVRLAAACPRLRAACLSGCCRLSDEGLAALAALTGLTALDLTDCAPPLGTARARAPGFAFRRPVRPGGGASGGSGGSTGSSADDGGGKRSRRSGPNDRGFASLVTALAAAPSAALQCPAPGRLIGSSAGTAAPPEAAAVSGPTEAQQLSAAAPAAGGLVSLQLGGTEAGDATLRAVSGLSRLELRGCRGVSDLGLLQALECCPGLQCLKLSGCSQLSPAALGASGGVAGASAGASGSFGREAGVGGAGGRGLLGSGGARGVNTRARALRKVSLPSALSSPAALSWLLGADLSSPLSPAASFASTPPTPYSAYATPGPDMASATDPPAAPARLAARGAGDDEGCSQAGSMATGKAAEVTAAPGPMVPLSTLWALQQLDCTLGPATGGGGGPGGSAAASAASASATDAFLRRLPSACPLLRSLRLRNAAGSGDEGAAAVLRGCRLLRRFSLSGCPLLTDATLQLALSLAADDGGPEASTNPLASGGGGVVPGGQAGGDVAQADAEEGEADEHAQWGRGGERLRGALVHLELSGCGAITGACPGLEEPLPPPHPAPAPACPDGRHRGPSASAHPEQQQRPPQPRLLLLSLSLEGCTRLRPRAVAGLVGSCPVLRELAAPVCLEGVRAAAKGCPHLRTLRITAVPGLGGAGDGWGSAGAWSAAVAAGAKQGANRGHVMAWWPLQVPGEAGEAVVWGALVRLEAPAVLRADVGLQAWAGLRCPPVQLAYT
ncbi:hypothetical protein HYH03_012674 [Edaphochlamys debaryana]|uniref:Uncharacterized protein n=1 Tax=Edaphochlamys debaryana TaxID=47281 RepID=A0A835XSH9_9CHLO|nr:hypothetical protein HYH03_012674 [Edaphochlamys debaryana]|eukprot:KAG2488880.1 hypothetical protein HYH03_012674 [Edaphochlamys debaryana]